MATKRTCWKLFPCAFYDIEKLESWLQDLAAQGWHQRQGCCVGGFEKGAPQQVHYRFHPKAAWYDGRTPDSDMEELFQNAGWEFVTAHGGFFIFRTEDEDARELNTEPQTLARGLRWMLWYMPISILLFCLVFRNHLWAQLTQPYLRMVTLGSVFAICSGVISLLILGRMLYKAVQIFLYYCRLKNAKSFEHDKSWHTGTLWLYVRRAFVAALWVILIAVTVVDLAVLPKEADILNYPGDPVIVTIADLCPNGEYTQDTFMDHIYNKYSEQENALGYCLKWRENAEVTAPNGEVLHGTIIAEYYEVNSDWLADGLVRDLERKIESEQGTLIEPIEVNNYGLEYVSAYQDVVSQWLMIKHGNVVISISIDKDLADLWLKMIAGKLR